jgi:hypothetical protein
LTSNGAADAYVVKLNASNGAVSWAVSYGGTSGDSPHAICIDASNNIYMLNSFNTSFTSCSATYTSLGSSDIVIQKISPSNGSCIWATSGGSASGDGGTGTAVCYVPESNKIVVSTAFSGATATFGAFSLSNVNGGTVQNDIAILELNASTGAYLSAISFGTSTADDASSCAYDPSTGDVFISGGFPSNMTVPNSGAGINLTTAGANDIWVGRYSPVNHYFVWAKSAGGSSGDINQEKSFSIASDGTGTIAISGSYISTTANFGSLSLSNSSGAGQIFVAGYSAATGTELWVNNASTATSALFSAGRGITTNTNSGTYWITGTFCTTSTFGSTSLTSAGFADLFNAKFTAPTAATVTSTAASGVGTTSATLGGNVTATGGATVTERGIVWATTSNPTIANTKVANGSGTGSFSGTVSSLPSGTLIHYRAYGINTAGVGYGADLTFTTTSANPDINITGNSTSIADGDATPSATDHTNFGSQSVCSGTIVRTFTIENTGTANLTLSTPALSGTNAADFSVTVNPSSPVSAPGSTTFQVTFNPSATGTRTATVTVTNNDTDEGTYDFAIQGTGTDPEVNVQGNGNSIADGDATPTSTDHTDFGGQDFCSGTVVRTFTVQNTGNANLTLATPTLSGTHAADFSVTATPTSPVSASSFTTFQVTFNPSATGTRSATITFTNNDCDEATYDFAIQGTGTGGSTWYQDNDGDGFGNSSVSLVACSQPGGYVADNSDCNDAQLRYLDGDSDTYGSSTLVACGGATNNTDCNDADGTINPGATEICGNGVDEDCAGGDLTCEWDGSESTDWSVAGNWGSNAVPGANAAVSIPSGPSNQPHITTGAGTPTQVGDLTIGSGATLTVDAGKALTVNGNLTNSGTVIVKADASAIGSLTTLGTVGGAGDFQMEQHLTGSGGGTPDGVFYYVSSPVVGATAATYDLASGNKLWSANEVTQDYDLITNEATALVPGQGYVARLGSTDVLTLSGSSFNTGTVDITGLTRTGSTEVNRGYNLVSNPYPSTVNWTTADKTNLEPTIWYRTHNGSTMLFDTYNLEGSGLGTNNNGGGEVSNLIPPTQAFWVRVAADGQTGSLSFDNATAATAHGAAFTALLPKRARYVSNWAMAPSVTRPSSTSTPRLWTPATPTTVRRCGLMPSRSSIPPLVPTALSSTVCTVWKQTLSLTLASKPRQLETTPSPPAASR